MQTINFKLKNRSGIYSFLNLVNVKIYRSKEYIPITGKAVPIEESSELLSSKIGENPIEDNTEVIEETKESSTPYSIENETNKLSS